MIPPGESRPQEGLLEDVRGALQSLLGLVRTRIEIFAVEVQEEKLRLIRLLIGIATGLSLLLAGILVAIGTLGIFLWHSAGYAGLILLAAGTLALGATVLLVIRKRLRTAAPPFPETTAEFNRDAACLRRE